LQQQAALPYGALICSELAMERLFSPCTRYRDLEESRGFAPPPESLRELNLNVSADEFLSSERDFTCADLYTMLGNGETIAWLTPHAFIAPADTGSSGILYRRESIKCRFRFIVDGKPIVAFARSSEALSVICDVFLRLVAASVVHSVLLSRSSRDGTSINAATLAYLMEQCQSLKTLTLRYLALDVDHCSVLGTYSRPDLEIELLHCVITGAGAIALAEVLGRNQGPTRLDYCEIDNLVIANGLRGNSRLKSFSPYFWGDLDIRNRQLLAIVDAIRENKGLVEWRLRCHGIMVMNDETWDAICDSLKTHPTLEVLDLSTIYQDAAAAPAGIRSRVQALLGMMEVNTSIHTIDLHDHYSQHEIFRESVVPYLETNRFRQHVRAIQKTLPIPYRAKVLGRALLAARNDPNPLWMLISGNAEVAFPSTTASTTPAASLPMPATAAPTSNATVVAATAAVTVTGTQLSSSIGVSAVDIVAIPTACQKRKTRP
jgi:hypothetical protein